LAVVEILKFVRPEAAFDPESIQVLASALDEAWYRIEQSGSHFARPAYSRVMREVIAKRIIEIAQQGVKDQQILVDDAVRFLAANYSDVRKQPA
jgi:dihydropteroate synthase